MKKTTEELLQLLKNSHNYSSYESQYREELQQEIPLASYFSDLILKKQLSKSLIIQRSGLDRGYAYDIFAGKKRPVRDKVLALCFGASLSTDETQELLRLTGYPTLYARLARDNVILFSLSHKLSVIDANILLEEMGMDILI